MLEWQTKIETEFHILGAVVLKLSTQVCCKF